MKLDHSASALVIVGGWNAHIFNPDWINRYLFDGKKEKLKVDILTELSHGFNPQFVLQRVSSKEVRIQLQGNKLSLNPIENKDKYFKKTEEIALLLADYLPHTPVSGFGMNFVFTENKVSKEIKKIIRPKDLDKIEKFGASLIGQQYTLSLELDNMILNFTIELKDKRITLKLNFHTEIRDLAQFKAKISETSMLTMKEKAVDFIVSVYNLELKGVINEQMA